LIDVHANVTEVVPELLLHERAGCIVERLPRRRQAFGDRRIGIRSGVVVSRATLRDSGRRGVGRADVRREAEIERVAGRSADIGLAGAIGHPPDLRAGRYRQVVSSAALHRRERHGQRSPARRYRGDAMADVVFEVGINQPICRPHHGSPYERIIAAPNLLPEANLRTQYHYHEPAARSTRMPAEVMGVIRDLAAHIIRVAAPLARPSGG